MKRVFDVVVSASALVLLAPVFLVIAIWIKLDSAGSVYFRQERVGRSGRRFRIHKFRTMHIDRNGKRPPLTASGDAAITASGQWLRRSKLDELPQLIDVLRGEMSLVGPRPELPVYVEAYPTDVRARVLSVRPGITNMESIAFWNESRMLAEADDIEALYLHSILPAKLKYADRYASEHGFWTDLRILLLTLKVLVTGSGPSVSGPPADRSAKRECEEQRLG